MRSAPRRPRAWCRHGTPLAPHSNARRSFDARHQSFTVPHVPGPATIICFKPDQHFESACGTRDIKRLRARLSELSGQAAPTAEVAGLVRGCRFPWVAVSYIELESRKSASVYEQHQEGDSTVGSRAGLSHSIPQASRRVLTSRFVLRRSTSAWLARHFDPADLDSRVLPGAER
jgi:hypothetical protein